MGIRSFFETIAETREKHPEEAMKTHYFRQRYTAVKDALLAYAKTAGYTVKHVNDTHGELYLEQKNHYVIATITQMNPVETGLDLKVGFESLIGFNRPRKTIAGIFAHMKQSLIFKGTGLNA
ncbi:MAG: hypothetical protein EA374_05925 [Acholeplasmatales bacterium]|nr:MAG: hypothetical protein EA374_05925 [Acholeplasmatales bacterium]